MPQSRSTPRTGLAGAVATLCTGWALAGGCLLLAVVLMNVVSVIGGIVWVPFPGDFELTEIGVAIAAFSFLPYTQINGHNVTADIFTAGAGPRTISALTCLSAGVALIFGGLLLWRMYAGMLDQKEYDYTTAILQVPVWYAFVPILVSLGLLMAASLVTLVESANTVRQG